MMLKIFSNFEELNLFAAEKFVALAKEAIKKRKKFTVALSGGSTPKALYALLASEKFRREIDWTRVFFFFGDERNVLPDKDESNFLMANETLFQPLKIAEDKIYRWQTEIEPPEHIAEDYAENIENFFQGFPEFDLILLGMGDDGHTASLFPHTAALHETKRIACANYVEKLNTTRLTLTFPVINNARSAMFLVKGADKSGILREVLEGDFQPEEFPSQAVKLTGGELFWLADEQAAALLAR
ncbi:MAG: 6-phosphogluconolactonase [Pyrinomonadaceae bacterium]|nr:6-phosphogluconolactonase [Pyrinomonadaceae bacterium]